MMPSALRKKSSFPSRLQAGCAPPPSEICHLPPPGGKDATKTSSRPVSSDSYAIHRPSGEKWPPLSW